MKTSQTPPAYIAFRVVAVAITVLVLLLTGLGLHGVGPLHSLGPVGRTVVSWLHANTGTKLR